MPSESSFLTTQSAIGASSLVGIALTDASFLTSAARSTGEVIGVDEDSLPGIRLEGTLPVPVLGVAGVGEVAAGGLAAVLGLLLLPEPQPAAAMAAAAIVTVTTLNLLLIATSFLVWVEHPQRPRPALRLAGNGVRPPVPVKLRSG